MNWWVEDTALTHDVCEQEIEDNEVVWMREREVGDVAEAIFK